MLAFGAYEISEELEALGLGPEDAFKDEELKTCFLEWAMAGSEAEGDFLGILGF